MGSGEWKPRRGEEWKTMEDAKRRVGSGEWKTRRGEEWKSVEDAKVLGEGSDVYGRGDPL